MDRLAFFKQYFAKPRSVGAILPSSRYLAEKMVGNIDFKQACYIVEYGPGTGVFTERLLKCRGENTTLLLLESNSKFYRILSEKYQGESNMYIVNDSAEYLDRYLSLYHIPRVDYFISGLPFASLPRGVSAEILDKTREYLNEKGKFITFQYTLLKKGYIQQYFKDISIEREVRNVPPAYVFCCS